MADAQHVTVNGHRFLLLEIGPYIEVYPDPRWREFFPLTRPRPRHAPSAGEASLGKGRSDRTELMFYASHRHVDTDGTDYPVLVLKRIIMHQDFRGTGLTTVLVKLMLKRFPDHLVKGEQSSPEAFRWHRMRLHPLFPTRMITDPPGIRQRLTPGQPIDPAELAD